ncbi:2OG-Fe(II) oxygenase [Variovorax rhizosphaerae]|uniref:2OG-Fe(II) oxygenase n=1 Tax=Variovorax rhizosphaerae TaxID=1836200 RepID=A0ABU8WIW9_9BURK
MLNDPAPVMIVDDFVGEAVVQRLLDYAIAHEAGFRPSRVALGHANEGYIDETHRVSKVNQDIDPVMPWIEPMIRKAVADAIPKLGLVNVDQYFLEPEIAWSGDGAFFKMHADTLRHRANPRVLTMVLYFHKEPKAFQGGELRLYGLGAQPDSGDDYREIEPRWDRAVFFPSWFPHEVLPVRCRSASFEDGRFALNCWVHRTSGNGT